eukprot:scaffold13706_cov121-Isochrysis_galbana.AAC.6
MISRDAGSCSFFSARTSTTTSARASKGTCGSVRRGPVQGARREQRHDAEAQKGLWQIVCLEHRDLEACGRIVLCEPRQVEPQVGIPGQQVLHPALGLDVLGNGLTACLCIAPDGLECHQGLSQQPGSVQHHFVRGRDAARRGVASRCIRRHRPGMACRVDTQQDGGTWDARGIGREGLGQAAAPGLHHLLGESQPKRQLKVATVEHHVSGRSVGLHGRVLILPMEERERREAQLARLLHPLLHGDYRDHDGGVGRDRAGQDELGVQLGRAHVTQQRAPARRLVDWLAHPIEEHQTRPAHHHIVWQKARALHVQLDWRVERVNWPGRVDLLCARVQPGRFRNSEIVALGRCPHLCLLGSRHSMLRLRDGDGRAAPQLQLKFARRHVIRRRRGVGHIRV